MKMKTARVCLLAACVLAGCAPTPPAVAETASPVTETVGIKLPLTQPTEQELLASYGGYGITFDENGKMLFHGEPIRYFCDGVQMEPGSWAIQYEYHEESGTVDVFTQRDSIDNGDGSRNPFGKLTGLERSSQKEFDEWDFDDFHTPANAITYVEATGSETGKSFTEVFNTYEPFGITYEEKRPGSGVGNIFYNGQSVKALIDEAPNGDIFTYSSKDGGTLVVTTVYNRNGKLTGVEASPV